MTLSKTPTGHPAGNALRPLNDCPPPASQGAPGDFFPTRRQASKSRRFTCHGPSRAQNGFEKSKMALAFSTGSTQAGAMSAPLRPRPTRALRCNFRRFESASTKKDRESRAIELRTPPSMNRQACPKKSFGNRNPGKQRQRPLITFRERSPAPRQSDNPTADPWARADCPKWTQNAQWSTRKNKGQGRRFRDAPPSCPANRSASLKERRCPIVAPPLPHTPPGQRRAPDPSVSNCRPEPKSIDRFN